MHGPLRDQQDFHYFKNDYGRIGNGDPHENLLNRQTGPCADKETDHLRVLKVPPVVWDRKSRFPDQANQQDEKQREAECAPVDEEPRHRAKNLLPGAALDEEATEEASASPEAGKQNLKTWNFGCSLLVAYGCLLKTMAIRAGPRHCNPDETPLTYC